MEAPIAPPLRTPGQPRKHSILVAADVLRTRDISITEETLPRDACSSSAYSSKCAIAQEHFGENGITTRNPVMQLTNDTIVRTRQKGWREKVPLNRLASHGISRGTCMGVVIEPCLRILAPCFRPKTSVAYALLPSLLGKLGDNSLGEVSSDYGL